MLTHINTHQHKWDHAIYLVRSIWEPKSVLGKISGFEIIFP